MKSKISIIIPFYNVEDYLEECIESVLSQTYRSFELILVDDGSDDQSLEKARRYAEIDQRINIICQENGGAAKARNRALDCITGDYILFVDSDDTIHPRMCEWLLAQNADIAYADYLVYQDALDKVESITSESVTTKEVAERLLLGKIEVGSCAKLFKKYIWTALRFPEDKKYEDYYTTTKAFLNAEKIVALKEPLYYYRRDREGQTTGKVNDRLLEALETKTRLIEELVSVYPDLAKYREACLYPTIVYIKSRFDMQPHKVSKEARKTIDDYFNNTLLATLKNPFIAPKIKVKAVLIKMRLFNGLRALFKRIT